MQLNKVQEILQQPEKYNKAYFDSISSAIFQLQVFIPVKATFDNLNSSGNLSLISNQELVNDLFMYYREIDAYFVSYQNSAESYSRDHIVPYFMTFDILSFDDRINAQSNQAYVRPKSLMDYAKSTFVINAVNFKNILLEGQLGYYILILEMNKEIITLIDKEL